ncbi:hypothetical protein DsansV1_C04g0047761 [Dioscorea sansibarensis]
MSLDINILFLEPLRPELEWFFPDHRVSSNGPDVDVDVRAFGDVIAGELNMGVGSVREHERGWRVEPESFFDEAVEVREVGEVRFCYDSITAYYAIKFFLSFLLDSWVLNQFRHCPFYRYYSCVHSRCDHVLYPKKANDGVFAEIILGLESEQGVDEVLLGTGLGTGTGVLGHNGLGETVTTSTVLGDGTLVQWEHPAEPWHVLAQRQRSAELEPVFDDGFELHSLLVYHSL